MFDAMHRAFFDKLFSLDDEGREAKAKLLREAGVPEELIAELTRPGIQPGMCFGGVTPASRSTVGAKSTPCTGELILAPGPARVPGLWR